MSVMSQSIKTIAPALLAAQREMGDAVKDSKNPFFKSNYADLNAVREAVMPALNKNGITVLQLNTPGPEGRQFVRTLLLHESGEYMGSDTEVVANKQNDPQALGSAISYARRYGLQSMLCVGAIDDDGEKALGRGSQAPAKPQLTVSASVVAKKETAPEVKTAQNMVDAVTASPAKAATKFPRPPKKDEPKKSGDMF